MTERLTSLQDAAFWDRAVCLDCGTVQQHGVEGDGPFGPCDECGSDAVYSAAFVLRCAEFAGQPDAEDEDDVG